MNKTLPTILLCLALPLGAAAASNLIPNGTFDHASGPFTGWQTDYAWTKNKHYVENAARVSVKPSEAGKAGVAQISAAGGGGTKIESIPIAFELGYKYTCEIDVKGGPYRLYFAGYQWEPGIRPHENPKPEELRLIYKSKVAKGQTSSWTHEKFDMPGLDVTPMAMKNLKEVRYVTVYVWMMETGWVDNVTVTRVPDPATKP